MSTERDEKEGKTMANANIRTAHKLLNELFNVSELCKWQMDLIRGLMPELPKQKTLEEIIGHVYDAWLFADGNEWGGNEDDPDVAIEAWLAELHEQLQGLKDTPAAVPALPTGMRIAVHAVYGRVVVSPVVDDDGTCKIFHLSTHARDGSDFCWAPIDSLTFIDYEPAKPAHPEFLETEADYRDAPEGTIVAAAKAAPIMKCGHWWESAPYKDCDAKAMAGESRRVLRWGWGK